MLTQLSIKPVSLLILILSLLQYTQADELPPSVCTKDALILNLDSSYKLWSDPQTIIQPDTLHTYIFWNKQTAIIQHNEKAKLLIVDPKNCMLRTLPTFVSILPPLLAIVLAILTRAVIISLVSGIIIGALLIDWTSILSILYVPLSTVHEHLIPAINSKEHISIIVFSIGIAGIAGILQKARFFETFVKGLAKFVKEQIGAQLLVWLSGLLIFFDDYANALIVGNTLRPLTDKLRISREKLAYLVDSTSAPVASIALITTWIGVELSYIQHAINTLNLDMQPYQIFIASLKYAFYPLLALSLILILIVLGREYGPMLQAERRARRGKVAPSQVPAEYPIFTAEVKEPSTISGLIGALSPIITLIAVTVCVLWHSGLESVTDVPDNMLKVAYILGSGDSFKALLWGTSAAFFISLVLTSIIHRTGLHKPVEWFIEGAKSLVPAIMVLVLAWTLADVLSWLKTSWFFTEMINMFRNSHYWYVPAVFLVSALMSFATGTSWGTMAIMYPLTLPAAWYMCMKAGIPEEVAIQMFSATAASVLGGAVFGDHCSPLSDTTILSALASGCPVVDHVKTQLPYAITAGIFALAGLILWSILVIHPIIILAFLVTAMTFMVRIVGIPVVLAKPGS